MGGTVGSTGVGGQVGGTVGSTRVVGQLGVQRKQDQGSTTAWVCPTSFMGGLTRGGGRGCVEWDSWEDWAGGQVGGQVGGTGGLDGGRGDRRNRGGQEMGQVDREGDRGDRRGKGRGTGGRQVGTGM